MNNKNTRYVFPIAIGALLFISTGWGFYSVIAAVLFLFYLVSFVFKAGEEIAFRPFILCLFGLNYLFAPALMYNGLDELQFYRMSIPEDRYFSYAIPAMLLMQLGMYCIRTDIFKKDLTMARTMALLNTAILKRWIVIGIAIKILSSVVPSEIGFLFYLISGIRFVGAFGLFVIDKRKYMYYLAAVWGFEIITSLAGGVFHDFLMWLIFFILLVAYLFKPKMWQKLSVIAVGGIAVFILQLTKNDYRARQNEGEQSGISAFSEAVSATGQKSEGGFFSMQNFAGALVRVNQAWIFASTVNNMDNSKDFQGMNLVGMYTEAAILPRFLAPNKLKAGDKEVFNKFAGKTIQEGTSMGLGILADGYISYGEWGIYIFAFAFGLILAIIFRIVQGWSDVSPFFIFFIFPMLNFAVRPDCETQTVIGHISKSLFVFIFVVRYSRRYFEQQLVLIERTGGLAEDGTETQEDTPGIQPATSV